MDVAYLASGKVYFDYEEKKLFYFKNIYWIICVRINITHVAYSYTCLPQVYSETMNCHILLYPDTPASFPSHSLISFYILHNNQEISKIHLYKICSFQMIKVHFSLWCTETGHLYSPMIEFFCACDITAESLRPGYITESNWWNVMLVSKNMYSHSLPK